MQSPENYNTQITTKSSENVKYDNQKHNAVQRLVLASDYICRYAAQTAVYNLPNLDTWTDSSKAQKITIRKLQQKI